MSEDNTKPVCLDIQFLIRMLPLNSVADVLLTCWQRINLMFDSFIRVCVCVFFDLKVHRIVFV